MSVAEWVQIKHWRNWCCWCNVAGLASKALVSWSPHEK